jgi:hypothetical protein
MKNNRVIITYDHLKLLKHFYVNWAGDEFGAPEIDPKRPYGNSDVLSDIAKIIGCENNEQTQNKLDTLHHELKDVLQICLSRQKFETGVFERADCYDGRSWTKVAELYEAKNYV